MTDYKTFLASKHLHVERFGFEPMSINPKLFDWQQQIVRWAIKRGRAALWEDCGLGKGPQQLEWASQVHNHTGGNILLLCPLAVSRQMIREAAKFDIQSPIHLVDSQSGVKPGINVTNYEKLHLFDTESFVGVSADESGILKSYTGATKRKLCQSFAKTQYRLACTATPAPNDRMELGNHSEFLSVMPSNEMLARWFINDSMAVGQYRLRKHGERDFWRWMSSWAVCISNPSDIGYPIGKYVLPKLNVHEHVIDSVGKEGFLFGVGEKISATEVHREKRSVLGNRVAKIGEIIGSPKEKWVIWCDTDYEQDAIEKVFSKEQYVSIRGRDTDNAKVDREEQWRTGSVPILISKPEIFGYGVNWQHCRKLIWFVGYSYERFYQAVRRCWRFGQEYEVDAHVIASESEQSIQDVIQWKQREHEEMKCEMAMAMRDGMMEELFGRRALKPANHQTEMIVPSWLFSKSA